MTQLDFTNQTARRQNTRAPLAGFVQSKLRGIVEHSDQANGSHPEEAFYAYKGLPIRIVDTTTEDGIVIPKGAVVSAITTKTNFTNDGFGEVADASSHYIGVDYSGGALSVSIDNSYWGYTEHVAALLIPANGGTAVASGNTLLDRYSTYDVGRTIKTDGSLVVTADAGNTGLPYTRTANYPLGIATQDVYQDLRGFNLNYQLFEIDGIATRGYVEYPFVDIYAADASGLNKNDALATLLDGTNVLGTVDESAPWYVEVARQHVFLYNTLSNANLLIPGSLIKSDLYGNLIPEWVAPVSLTAGTQAPAGAIASAALDQALVTAQTVARLHVTDSRYPKDMMETVQTYPGSEMPGTDTGGLPAVLFNFTKDVLIESGYNTAPTIKNILDVVQQGIFGVARMELVLA